MSESFLSTTSKNFVTDSSEKKTISYVLEYQCSSNKVSLLWLQTLLLKITCFFLWCQISAKKEISKAKPGSNSKMLWRTTLRPCQFITRTMSMASKTNVQWVWSNLSKVFDKLIYSQLNTYMSENVSKYLAEYRKNHNTQDALLNRIENWGCNLNKGL